MVSVTAIALVVLSLERRNEVLLTRVAGEARTDALTGRLNRCGFAERAHIELAHANRDNRPVAVAVAVAVAILDIDHVKHIDDEWGYQTGDRVLTRFGALLRAECRDIDVAARLGGEEFIVLFPGEDFAAAAAFTERVRRALRAADASGLPTVRSSAGAHAAISPDDMQPMLKRADSAMYQAKRAGRDQTVTSETYLDAQRKPVSVT